jgi:peptidoglycan hydrolase-like protein with peptidoglycan-binding domain
VATPGRNGDGDETSTASATATSTSACPVVEESSSRPPSSRRRSSSGSASSASTPSVATPSTSASTPSATARTSVSLLQTILGLDPETRVQTTGIFDANTATALGIFRAKYGDAPLAVIGVDPDTLETGSTPTRPRGNIARTMGVGAEGADVRTLQELLNSDPDTKISESGVGSPGNETDYFGAKTADAVRRFQEKYATEVLLPSGLSQGTGYVGPSTLKKIEELLGAKTGEATTPATSPASTPTEPSATFSRDLEWGMSGEDVRRLQVILNSDPGTRIAESGIGSPGNETDYFGEKTTDAVRRFQEKYRNEVLTPGGFTSSTGYVGPLTRTKLEELAN